MKSTDRREDRLDETLKLRISSELRARVKARALTERRSEAAVARLALERYLDDGERAAA